MTAALGKKENREGKRERGGRRVLDCIILCCRVNLREMIVLKLRSICDGRD
jgi:hypothetical protein